MRMLRRRAEEREREVPDVSHSPDGYPEEMKVRSAGKERDDIPEDDHVRDVDAAVAERLLAEHREQRDDLGTLLRISGFPAKHPETHLDAVLRFLDAEAAVANLKPPAAGRGPERRQLASSRVQVKSCGSCTWYKDANGTLTIEGPQDCGSTCTATTISLSGQGIKSIGVGTFNRTGLSHVTTL